MRIGGAKWAILLGPVAVHPTRQGEGLGAALILRALDLAREGGWSRVMLVGDAPYYGRFGFRRLDGVVMPPPTNPDRVLGVALREGAWDGVTGEVGAGGGDARLKRGRGAPSLSPRRRPGMAH